MLALGSSGRRFPKVHGMGRPLMAWVGEPAPKRKGHSAIVVEEVQKGLRYECGCFGRVLGAKRIIMPSAS
ncbi:hypothetical protein Z043_115032 [Scleropages formosus]|uniref:Uncharacterized protein n=1 Tax=Scleropages formosus TaxID=113540 RepID=A0A0P7V2B3_SCLFO|nr:hypothetical protein Z043_115032 [Scleropages formosus]